MRLLFFSFFCITGIRAQVIFKQYFPLKAGTVQRYYANVFPPYDIADETVEKKICRSVVVKGKNVFYFITPEKEKEGKDAIIGSEAFVDGVMYYDRGRLMRSPVFWKYELKNAAFDVLFPAEILLNNVYTKGEGHRLYTFTGFEKIQIKDQFLDSCLKLIIKQKTVNVDDTDTIWFRKKLGVVKWIRTTGRLEELKL